MSVAVKKIDRIELYRRVCETPLSKLAPELGMSATTLASICRAHDVPYPGSGYWTRRSLGLSTELVPLPTSNRQGADADVVDLPVPKPRRGTALPTGQTSEPDATSPTWNNTIVVSEKLERPHPLVAKWIESRVRRRREALRSGEDWRIRNAPLPWSDLETRGHRILDAIFKAVESRGGTISEGHKGRARATIDGQNIDFLIREKNRQVTLAADDDRRSYRSTDLIGTGKLVLGIKTYLRGRHNEEWNETDAKPLEGAVAAFVERLFEGAIALKAWELERELERKRWAEEAARRAEVQRLKADDEAKRARLLELSEQWQTAQRLEGMLDALLAGSHDPTTLIGQLSIQDWTLWARGVVTELRGSVGTIEALFLTLNNVKSGRAQ